MKSGPGWGLGMGMGMGWGGGQEFSDFIFWSRGNVAKLI